jgi:secreted trypsin-like serine protease
MKKKPFLFILSILLMTVIIFTLFGSIPVAQAQDGDPPPEDATAEIVGGQLASPGEWPWQVALVDKQAVAPNFNDYQFCGGSLINPYWVLTAAHCVTENNGSVSLASSINIVAGIYDLNNPPAGYQRRSVAQIIRHESYNPKTTDFDIALLKLTSPVMLGRSGAAKTGLISLAPSTIGDLAGLYSWVTGWGNTSPIISAYPDKLYEVNVPIVANSICNNSSHYDGDITNNMLCAGSSGKDSCQGDSGGPLVIANSSRWQQAGIVSWGDVCGAEQYPGVYTRVSNFVGWVNASRGPSVLDITRGSANPAFDGAVTFIVNFTEDVSGVDISDFTLTQSGSVSGATVDSVVPTSASIYVVTASAGTGSGTLRLDVVDDDSILDTDLTPKALGESGTGNGNFTSGAAYSMRPITETYYSQPDLDGEVLEYTELSDLGGSSQSVGGLMNLGDDRSNRQYRDILSFDTSFIDDAAVITKVTLSVKRDSAVGRGNPVNLFKGFMVDVRKGTFGASPLKAHDFQAKEKPIQTLGPISPALSSGWYSFDLTDAAGMINKASLTQIRLRFNVDDNNNHAANFIKIFSGNAEGTTSDPQLTIAYYMP